MQEFDAVFSQFFFFFGSPDPRTPTSDLRFLLILEHTCSHETMWPWILMDPLSVQELRAKVQHFGYIMRRVLDL